MLRRVETRVVLVGNAGTDAALVKALEVKISCQSRSYWKRSAMLYTFDKAGQIVAIQYANSPPREKKKITAVSSQHAQDITVYSLHNGYMKT